MRCVGADIPEARKDCSDTVPEQHCQIQNILRWGLSNAQNLDQGLSSLHSFVFDGWTLVGSRATPHLIHLEDIESIEFLRREI